MSEVVQEMELIHRFQATGDRKSLSTLRRLWEGTGTVNRILETWSHANEDEIKLARLRAEGRFPRLVFNYNPKECGPFRHYLESETSRIIEEYFKENPVEITTYEPEYRPKEPRICACCGEYECEPYEKFCESCLPS